MNSPNPRAERLVLVTGAGRSGTSTVAGALHYLGLHVPLPVLKPNASNPQGFFESTWPLWFHRRLMDQAVIEQTDGRPEAQTLMAGAVTPEIRAELHDWLAGVAAEADQLLVKDPRSIWVPWLWEETARDLGMSTGFLTMLRHPAEVVGSRSTYYGGNRTDKNAWKFAVGNLCGWVNGNLVVERQTRGRPRVVLRYNDLIGDWRAAMTVVRQAFDLTYPHDFAPGQPHRVDEFVDPTLRRHQPTWDGMDMPPDLVELAEGVWAAMSTIGSSGGADPTAEKELDAIGGRYEELMLTAQAVARDTALSQAKAARRKAERETRELMQKKVAKARAAAKRARAQAQRSGSQSSGSQSSETQSSETVAAPTRARRADRALRRLAARAGRAVRRLRGLPRRRS